jgi:hypothetical protein
MRELVPIVDTDLDYDPDSTLEGDSEGYDTESSIHTTQTEGSSDEQSGASKAQPIANQYQAIPDTSGNTEDIRYVIMGNMKISNITVPPEDVGAHVITVGNIIGSLCPICPKMTTRLKQHMLTQHLPWFVRGPSACFACRTQCGTVPTLQNNHSSCTREANHMIKWAERINFKLLMIAESLGLFNSTQLIQLTIQQKLFPESQTNNLRV